MRALFIAGLPDFMRLVRAGLLEGSGPKICRSCSFVRVRSALFASSGHAGAASAPAALRKLPRLQRPEAGIWVKGSRLRVSGVGRRKISNEERKGHANRESRKHSAFCGWLS